MSYAVIRSGGKQFRVEKGAQLRVPVLDKKVGDSVEFDVLVSGEGDQTKIGTPLLESKAVGKVVDHGREPKIIVFKMKRRKHYKRTRGHRQGYTTVKIESIG